MLLFLVRVGPLTHCSRSIRRVCGVGRIIPQCSILLFPFTRCHEAAVWHGSATLPSSLSGLTAGVVWARSFTAHSRYCCTLSRFGGEVGCMRLRGRVRLRYFTHCSL